MIPMNFMKSKAGFTLVELIVVIAILGILAGIAVPAYSGYIKKAESAADTQVLSAVYTAAASAYAATGDVTRIDVTATDGNITKVVVNSDNANPLYEYNATEANCKWNADFKLYIGTGISFTAAELKDDGTYDKGAYWTGGKWTANS